MTCFIGVDLHKTQFTVHTRTENRVESMDQIIQYPVTNEGYANFLKRIRNLKTRGYEVKIGVESTGNTRYFKSQVEKAGAEVTVINTLKFKVINESTKKQINMMLRQFQNFFQKTCFQKAIFVTRKLKT